MHLVNRSTTQVASFEGRSEQHSRLPRVGRPSPNGVASRDNLANARLHHQRRITLSALRRGSESIAGGVGRESRRLRYATSVTSTPLSAAAVYTSVSVVADAAASASMRRRSSNARLASIKRANSATHPQPAPRRNRRRHRTARLDDDCEVVRCSTDREDGRDADGDDDDGEDDDDYDATTENFRSQAETGASWDEVDARVAALFGATKDRDLRGGGGDPASGAAPAAEVDPKLRREALDLACELERWRTLAGPCGHAAARHLRELQRVAGPLRATIGLGSAVLPDLSPHTSSQLRSLVF